MRRFGSVVQDSGMRHHYLLLDSQDIGEDFKDAKVNFKTWFSWTVILLRVKHVLSSRVEEKKRLVPPSSEDSTHISHTHREHTNTQPWI